MKEKVNQWVERMEAWKVAPHLVMISYKTALWPAIRYSLSVSQLRERDIKKAMRKLMSIMKHAAYLSSKFLESIMNLPLTFGGYRIKEVSKEMVFQQVQMFLSAYRSGGNTGIKVKALLEYH